MIVHAGFLSMTRPVERRKTPQSTRDTTPFLNPTPLVRKRRMWKVQRKSCGYAARGGNRDGIKIINLRGGALVGQQNEDEANLFE